MIRKATRADIPRLLELAVEALRIDEYETLVIARDRIEFGIEYCITDPHCFAWVSEDESGIRGGLGAIVVPLPAYERNQCQVMMLYCKKANDGAKLIREFRNWVSVRPMIKQVLYTPERGADPRIGELFNRIMSGIGNCEDLHTCVMTR